MKEADILMNDNMKEEFSYDASAELRRVSELIRRDMLRYIRVLDAEEEADEG